MNERMILIPHLLGCVTLVAEEAEAAEVAKVAVGEHMFKGECPNIQDTIDVSVNY
jgi:hypothetical protein